MKVGAGLARLAGRALDRWGEVVWGILLERSLRDDLQVVEPPGIDVTLRLAVSSDIDEISRLYATDPWLYILHEAGSPGDHAKARELYLERLRRGELCYLALSGGAIAHVNWSCFTFAEALPNHPIRLREGEVFTTDGMTLPAFRGKGVHAFVLRTMLDDARRRGIQHVYTLGRLDRPEPFPGLSQLGFKECGHAIYFVPRGSTRARFLWRQGNLEPLFRAA